MCKAHCSKGGLAKDSKQYSNENQFLHVMYKAARQEQEMHQSKDSILALTTIPRPPSIEDRVDGERKSPASTTAVGFGDSCERKVCTRGKFATS
jgi:hypothetical protein